MGAISSAGDPSRSRDDHRRRLLPHPCGSPVQCATEHQNDAKKSLFTRQSHSWEPVAARRSQVARSIGRSPPCELAFTSGSPMSSDSRSSNGPTQSSGCSQSSSLLAIQWSRDVSSNDPSVCWMSIDRLSLSISTIWKMSPESRSRYHCPGTAAIPSDISDRPSEAWAPSRREGMR